MSERLQTSQCNKSRTSSSVLNQSKILDKNRKPLVLHPPLVQTKLAINQSGDKYEQEADLIPEQVIRMPNLVFQRKCARCNEDEKKTLQGKGSSGQIKVGHGQNVTPLVREILDSPDQPLCTDTRAFMEPRIGFDFSRVRVHSSPAVEKSAQEVNANDYTIGHNIVFGTGQFAPETHGGRRLIAHELTHVVQQLGGDRIHVDQANERRILSPNYPSVYIVNSELSHLMQQQQDGASLIQRKEDNDKDETKDNPKDKPEDKPKEPEDKPKDKPEDKPKEPEDKPKDAPIASGSCGGKSLASSISESNKRLNGSKVEASLDADEFGNTSKLGADFKFSACKVGKNWRFQLDALVVPIASKVQPITFRKNIDSASAADVTKDSFTDIVRDLSPTRTATFSVSCGHKKDKDKVKTYSIRKTYWNQQFVINHEAFHRKDWVDMYKKELVKAENDVSAHSIPEGEAKDAASAVAKANPDLTKYMTDAYQRLCDVFTPGKESRAYDAGAPAYQKLVDEINARAKKENW